MNTKVFHCFFHMRVLVGCGQKCVLVKLYFNEIRWGKKLKIGGGPRSEDVSVKNDSSLQRLTNIIMMWLISVFFLAFSANT